MSRTNPLPLFLLAAFALFGGFPGQTRGGDILNSPHNLSAAAPAVSQYRAAGESRVCVFCHTPHFADPAVPLWNHEMNGAVYDLYESSTLSASPTQPEGPSRLCLSCHDGTIALGSLVRQAETVPFQGGATTLDAGDSSNLSTDLSDDHPICFVYDEDLALRNGQLRSPGALPPQIELQGGMMHCTSCHDPHDNSFDHFLVMDNTDSALCTTCHSKTGWSASTHKAQNTSCQDCHVPHNAARSARLLRTAMEEDLCLGCHDGSRAGDVATSFDLAQTSVHQVELAAGVHDPAEDPNLGVLSSHVECGDCHDPHQVNGDLPLVDGGVGGRNKGVKGVDLYGSTVDPARYEYEICFKCHADPPMVALVGVPRQIEDPNERSRFDPNNPSYHPVTGGGRSFDVPSLRPGLNAGFSRITCSACHNTDNGTRAGGSAANGVHGSSEAFILLERYWLETTTKAGPAYNHPYVESDYSLCWRCHDPDILLQSATFHESHVANHEVPCFVCHDPHGVPGSAVENVRLINFTTLYGLAAYHDAVARSCTSSCHSNNPRFY